MLPKHKLGSSSLTKHDGNFSLNHLSINGGESSRGLEEHDAGPVGARRPPLKRRRWSPSAGRRRAQNTTRRRGNVPPKRLQTALAPAEASPNGKPSAEEAGLPPASAMAIARTERVGNGVEGYAGPAEVTPGHPVPGRRRARGKFSFGCHSRVIKKC